MKEEVHRGALVNDTTVYAALAIIMIRIWLLHFMETFFSLPNFLFRKKKFSGKWMVQATRWIVARNNSLLTRLLRFFLRFCIVI